MDAPGFTVGTPVAFVRSTIKNRLRSVELLLPCLWVEFDELREWPCLNGSDNLGAVVGSLDWTRVVCPYASLGTELVVGDVAAAGQREDDEDDADLGETIQIPSLGIATLAATDVAG